MERRRNRYERESTGVLTLSLTAVWGAILWAGFADAALSPPQNFTYEKDCLRRSKELYAAGTGPVVQVMGMFDSGTNFLHHMLAVNGIDVGAPRDCFQRDCVQHTVLWKHLDPNLIPRNLSKVVFAVVIRNPLAWRQSVTTSPYLLADCLYKPPPCRVRQPTQCLGEPLGPPFGHGTASLNGTYTSIDTLWGEHYRRFYKLKEDYPLLFIRFEDLLEDPITTMTAIRRGVRRFGVACAGTCISGNWTVVRSAAKHHGTAHNFSTALLDLQTKTYLSNSALQPHYRKICRDPTSVRIMRRHSYDDCSRLP